MDGIDSTAGLIAIAGAAVGAVALVLAVVLAVRLRAVRSAQRHVLGTGGERDLVEQAAQLEQGFVALRDWVEETAQAMERRTAAAETRIDGCVAYRSVVRYDAYGEMSGQQSSSVALLDEHRSGVVLSSILHRETSRVYVKQVVEGQAEHELSPEEQEAVAAALAGQSAAGA